MAPIADQPDAMVLLDYIDFRVDRCGHKSLAGYDRKILLICRMVHHLSAACASRSLAGYQRLETHLPNPAWPGFRFLVSHLAVGEFRVPDDCRDFVLRL